jgi:tetratricopeptide (TPR) repeat protein
MVLESQAEELETAEKLIQEGKFEEALVTIKNFMKKSGISEEERLSALILEGRLHGYTVEVHEMIRVGELAYKLGQKLGSVPETIEALIIKSLILHFGKLDESLEFINEAEILIDRLTKETKSELPQERADTLLAKSWAYLYKGDLKMALELALQGLSLRENLDEEIPSGYYDANLLLGYIYIMRGDPNTALNHAAKDLEIQKKRNNADWIAGSLVLHGGISFSTGDLDSSIKYCNQALSISNNSNLYNINAFLYLGRSYYMKGELDQALQYHEQALAFSNKCGKFNNLGVIWRSTGNVYRMKGDLDKAVEFVKRSLEFFEEFNLTFDFYIGICLFRLVSLYLETNMREEAELYMSRLKEIADKSENAIMIQYYQMTKALILKSSGRARNRAEAEILLKQIVEGEIIYIEAYITSLVSLCEFLLEELENSEESEILDEINPLITRLLEIAENQHSYSILAETKLLQGRLALIRLNLVDARQFLTTAQKIANDHGLTLLAQKISHEHDVLLEELDTWRSLKKTQASVSKRMKLASIDGVIDRMQGRRAIEVPEISIEEPILLLIMDKSGVSYFNHSFIGDWDFDDLFSSFMSAFNTFSGEIFSKSIDRVKIADNTILINPIEPFLACYIIKGQSYPAQQKLFRFSDAIKTKTEIWEALNRAAKTSEILQLDNPPSLGSTVNEIFLS